jgi:hypothetical protein
MIKGLQGISGLTVTGGTTSLPYVAPNANNPMTGMLRINNTEIEVFNGSMWQQLSTSYATVGLDQETQNLLSWAKSKQRQEIELLEMATKNEAVRIALENVKKAQDNLTITAHLSREYETTS